MATNADQEAPADPRLVLANWKAELDAVDLYSYLAEREPDSGRAAVLRDMAAMEARHARVMERGLARLGVGLPQHRLGAETRILKFFARLFGPRVVYPILQSSEIAGTADYAAQDETTAALAPEERSHARILAELTKTTAAGHERWHRAGGGGVLRASVFGISDGLVSNLSLVMGFAGAGADAKFILLAGLAGLLSGAASMAAGEYVSVKAQRELLERQIGLEAAELAVTPQEEMEELVLIYRAKGLAKDDAERLVANLLKDRHAALDTLVREELGLDPGSLGSPTAAATSSFFSFAFGALLPVLPFFFGASLGLIVASIVISGVALFAVGAVVSAFTGRGMLYSGLRQLLIGGAAAAVTFGLGALIGASAGI